MEYGTHAHWWVGISIDGTTADLWYWDPDSDQPLQKRYIITSETGADLPLDLVLTADQYLHTHHGQRLDLEALWPCHSPNYAAIYVTEDVAA